MPETITGQYWVPISSQQELSIMSSQYRTDNAWRYHFDFDPILDADILPISANIGPILRRLQIVPWEPGRK